MVLAAAERSQLLLAAVEAQEIARVQEGGELSSGQRDDLKRLALPTFGVFAEGWLARQHDFRQYDHVDSGD
jgi:hypothetical protein